MACETPTCELNHSSAIQVASTSFLLVFSIALQGLAFLVWSIHVTQIDKQWSSGVVTARVRSSVRNLPHQCQDLHQSTYLYLLEDRDLTSHHDSLEESQESYREISRGNRDR
jgi:hypothetical protein